MVAFLLALLPTQQVNAVPENYPDANVPNICDGRRLQGVNIGVAIDFEIQQRAATQGFSQDDLREEVQTEFIDRANRVMEVDLGIRMIVDSFYFARENDAAVLLGGNSCRRFPSLFEELLPAWRLLLQQHDELRANQGSNCVASGTCTKRTGAWNLLSSCQDASSVIGAAPVGAICGNSFRIFGGGIGSVMTWNFPSRGATPYWQTFGHEMGHILGSGKIQGQEHTQFGIMQAVANPSGVNQDRFSKTSQRDICNHIEDFRNNPATRPLFEDNCFFEIGRQEVAPEENPVAPEENPITPEENPFVPEEMIDPEEDFIAPEENPFVPEEMIDPEEDFIAPEVNPFVPEEMIDPEEDFIAPEENLDDPEENPQVCILNESTLDAFFLTAGNCDLILSDGQRCQPECKTEGLLPESDYVCNNGEHTIPRCKAIEQPETTTATPTTTTMMLPEVTTIEQPETTTATPTTTTMMLPEVTNKVPWIVYFHHNLGFRPTAPEKRACAKPDQDCFKLLLNQLNHKFKLDSILNKVVTTIRKKVNQLKDINAIKRQDRLRKKPVMNEEDKIRKLYEHSCEELFKIKLFPKKGRNLIQAESADTATAPSLLKTLIQNIESI